jgi:hypothetical protein
VRGWGATPKRKSAGLLMARRPAAKPEVGVRWRFKVRDSGLGFTGGRLCLTVSALCVMLNDNTPLVVARGMDESHIRMNESWVGRSGNRGHVFMEKCGTL